MSHAPGAERLKVVLDTNLYIAAFQYPKGRNAALWRAARAGSYRLLFRPPPFGKPPRCSAPILAGRRSAYRTSFRRIANVAGDGLIAPRTPLSVVVADPDDNRIL